ncbi:MAG: prepilin-type N-terminal cleavage/methylation domain-containing protein [Phycisphaerae bacterium]|nr:prepilin-type N-terminal cleavage/methylation domain-containing protein [Phycisphaerae bacterium]
MRIQIRNAGTGNRKKSAFTLIELMVTLLISAIIISAVGVMVSDSSGWFSDSYEKIYSQPAVESLLARKTFEAVIRQSSDIGLEISPDGSSAEIYYYSSPANPLDSYARFYVTGTDLILEKGSISPSATTSTETVCRNVSQCTFKAAGSSVQMILILDDGKNKQGSVTSAILHN